MGDPVAAFVPTRRVQRRADTLAEIMTTAREHLRRDGPSSLSLRAVARDLGMSGPGLYRYYASRDDLLTALVADGLSSLAESMEAAREGAGPELRDRLQAVCGAYRDWAGSHVAEFGLVFDAPLPHYAAPPGGPTVTAMQRFGRVMVGLISEGWEAARPSQPLRPSVDGGRGVSALSGAPSLFAGLDLPPDPELALTLCTFWSRLHGLTTLGAYGHLEPAGVGPELYAELWQREVDGLMDGLGLPRSA